MAEQSRDASVPFTSNTLLKKKKSNIGDMSPEQVLWDQFPASYRINDDLHAPHGIPPFHLIEGELEPRRLHRRIRFLWLAGRPVPPRPLHHQPLLGREICVSEKMDLHLVWGGGRMFLKPIPRYLMDPAFWRDHLTCRCAPEGEEEAEKGPRCTRESSDGLCERHRVRRCAMGFLLSYVALVAHESDFNMAVEKGLIPKEVEWPCWRKFVREILQKSQENMWRDVAERFIYGELRLNRLNMIEIVLSGPLSEGFLATWTSFGSFYRYCSALIIAGAAYILLILSAMQVGLGVPKLAEDEVFQAASYGFAVFSILGPLGAVVVVVILFVIALVYHTLRTRRFEARRARRLGRTWRAGQTMEDESTSLAFRA